MEILGIDEAGLLSRVLAQAAPERAAAPARSQAEYAAAEASAWRMPGILGSTRVTTSFGHVPAQLVRVGDSLKTREGSFLRVERITDLRIDEDFLARRPDAAPAVFRRNALGAGVPHQDVALSPAQAIAVGPNRFEERQVPAADLSRERGRIDKSLGMMVYYRFHLGREALIHCDGIWVATD